MARRLFVPIAPKIPGFKTSVASSAAKVGSSSQTVLTGPNLSTNQNYNMNPLAQAGQQVFDTAVNAGAQAVAEGVSELIRTGAGRVKSGIADGPRPTTKHSSGYSLSQAPDPKPVNLDSGIAPKTYVSDYLDAETDVCSPLHLTSGIVQVPTTTQSPLYNYFINVIAFDIQTKAQANVSFNINQQQQFTADKILTAMNAVLSAAQIYFFYTSLISYFAVPGNKNQGMVYLRQKITPQALENVALLRRRLADTPIPPRMYELLRYLAGNYQSGITQGSPLIKIVPTILRGNDILLEGDLSAALATLNTTANNDVYTLLRRAVPAWKPGMLYDVPSETLFDLNFTTIFANAPYCNYIAGALDYYPKVADNNTSIAYNSFTNTLDGTAYALTGMFSTTTNSFLPGLMSPVVAASALFGESRKSFYKDAGVTNFVTSRAYPFLVRARAETYSTNNLTTTSGHLFGTDRCNNVNVDSVRETSELVMDYLFSADTISGSGPKRMSSKSDFKAKPGKKRAKTGK